MITRRAFAGAAVTAPFIARAAFAQAATLNVNSALTADDPLFKGLEAFKAGVEKRSAGRLLVKLFPSSQLGPDEDVLEQARAGAGVAVVVDGGRLAPFAREFGILGAPYVANGFPELRKLATSKLFDQWTEKLRNASNHQVLSFNWFQGERHLLTNVPVSKPADLAGVRMRTPGAPVWLETIRAMGATPTPLPWTEVYSALQLKAIDACEAQLPAVWGSRLYEVIKIITKTAHINLITGLVVLAAVVRQAAGGSSHHPAGRGAGRRRHRLAGNHRLARRLREEDGRLGRDVRHAGPDAVQGRHQGRLREAQLR